MAPGSTRSRVDGHAPIGFSPALRREAGEVASPAEAVAPRGPRRRGGRGRHGRRNRSSTGELAGHRHAVPLGIHALDVAVVVATLRTVARRGAGTAPAAGTEQQPGPCTDTGPARAADGRAGHRTDRGAQHRAASGAVGSGLFGRAADWALAYCRQLPSSIWS